MKKILIIEREFGAGGAAVAAKAAERLGWRLLDQELTDRIARLARVDPAVCQKREERPDSLLYRLARVFWRGSYQSTLTLQDTGALDAERLMALSQQVISEAAATGECVIVGRGAPYFLRDRTDTFVVFLFAPYADKLRRVSARATNAAEAEHWLSTVDEQRREFIRQYFHREWPYRPLYDAMLNTALGEDATVEAILRLMELADREPGRVAHEF